MCLSVLATGVIFSDLYYLLLAKFATYQLLLLSVTFVVLLPILYFLVILHDNQVFPYPLIDYYPYKNSTIFWFWLSHQQGNLTHSLT